MSSGSRDIRSLVFAWRSYTPLPFLAVMVWYAEPTPASMLIGFALVAGGEVLRFWGVSIVGSETRTTGTVGGTYLVTSGPFAYVRNPLYLGNMVMYGGVGIMSLALFPWLLLAALLWFFVQYTLIVTREEEYLAQRFGKEYDLYREQVPRFLPRATPYLAAAPAPKIVHLREGLASERRTLQAIALVTLLVVAKFAYLSLRA